MALKTCPDCQTSVSTEAAACPRCGRRMVPASSARWRFIIPGVLVAIWAGYMGWDGYKKHQRAEQEHRRQELLQQMDDILAQDRAAKMVVRGGPCFLYWAGTKPEPDVPVPLFASAEHVIRYRATADAGHPVEAMQQILRSVPGKTEAQVANIGEAWIEVVVLGASFWTDKRLCHPRLP